MMSDKEIITAATIAAVTTIFGGWLSADEWRTVAIIGWLVVLMSWMFVVVVYAELVRTRRERDAEVARNIAYDARYLQNGTAGFLSHMRDGGPQP